MTIHDIQDRRLLDRLSAFYNWVRKNHPEIYKEFERAKEADKK